MNNSSAFRNEDRLKFKLFQFKQSLRTLEEACRDAVSALEKDGTVQRFRYTFEMSWKALRYYLLLVGSEVSESPRLVFREAIKLGILRDIKTWEGMTDSRLISNYEDLGDLETNAETIFLSIKSIYLLELQRLESLLETVV